MFMMMRVLIIRQTLLAANSDPVVSSLAKRRENGTNKTSSEINKSVRYALSCGKGYKTMRQ